MAPKRKQTNPKETASPAAGRRSPRLAGLAAPAAPPADPEPRKTKKAKIKTEATTSSSSAADGSKTVVIEHCKQCNSFETTANQVKAALEREVAGVKVEVNPENPRRDCFEIRQEGEGGEVFVSLLETTRPFPPLKELDVDTLIADIVEKIQ